MMTISIKKKKNIGVNNFNLTGAITNIKANEHIHFHHSFEYDFIYCLEFDKGVMSYYEQPFILTHYHADTRKTYKPSFFVEYWNGKKVIYDLKQDTEFNKNSSQISWFKAAREFCNQNNITFKVLSEENIYSSYFFNAKFLLDFKEPKYGFNLYDTNLIYDILSKNTMLTVMDLLNIASMSFERKSELLYVLWYMISNYLVDCNLDRKLNMQTIIWLP